jgi:hypothetical protein
MCDHRYGDLRCTRTDAHDPLPNKGHTYESSHVPDRKERAETEEQSR